MPRCSLLRPQRSTARPLPAASLPPTLAVLLMLALMLTAATLLLAVAAPVRAAGAAPARGAVGDPGLVLPEQVDLSGLSWIGAFAELHTKMAREYGLTGWKRVDWPALYTEYAPQVARAQWAGDEVAYFRILSRYVHGLRDGHATIKPFLPKAQAVVDETYARYADGGFGLVPARLEDGHVVAAWVQPGGPAARAGIKAGARLLRWSGRPLDAALLHADTTLSPCYPTDARLDRERLRFLTRARVGAARVVTFRNRGASLADTARLTAVADDRVTLAMTDERSTLVVDGWPEKVVEDRIIDGVGYVKVRFELDLPAELPGVHTPTLQLFREAIAEFVDAGARGVIVDLRGNSGGSDQMVADMMGSLCGERAFYEYGRYFNTATGRFELWDCDETTLEFTQPASGIWIEPEETRFSGPVVALVDNACVSSGEGLAMAIRRLPNGRTVGFHGTNGSFGMAGDGVLMPLGFHLVWPYGSSLDEDKVVQLDSRLGRGGWTGGVAPDLRVPATARNLSRTLRGEDVVLEYGLRELARMAD